MTIDKLFMAKVIKCPLSGCWLWQGSLNGRGYGHLGRRRNGKCRHYRAHRYSYELHNGPIPDGMCVCHTCDVRFCVNPDHVFLGTHADNIKDRDLKGRTHSKLTDEDVTSISMFLNLGAKGRDIANAYGVSQATVSNIKNGRWQIAVVN